MSDQIKDKICFALDVNEASKALEFVSILKDYVGYFKVGMQLYTKEGPGIVKRIIRLGGKVFLDLKYHDIPNTVASTAKEVVDLGVSLFNVHALGGMDMLKATVDAVHQASFSLDERPKIIAVTVLTSISENILNGELRVYGILNEYVNHLASMTKSSGLDGIVCSPQETKTIKERFGNDFFVVNPGIRPHNSDIGDQKRYTTHIEALENGADLLVIGRPIRESVNPLGTAQSIYGSIEEYYRKVK